MSSESKAAPIESTNVTRDASRMEAFIACTADAVIGFDTNGFINLWNPSAERMFQFTKDEAIGQSYTLIGTAEVKDFQDKIFSETIKGDVHQWYDTQRRRRDGSLIDCAITTSPLIYEGEVQGLVAIIRDISERVAASKQLAELNAQLVVTAEDKRAFVNMVLHDLRHPLATIQVVMHLLMRAEESEREKHFQVLEGRVKALAGLLDELTNYYRIEAGFNNLHLELVDVNQQIIESLCNFEPALVGDSVAIKTNLACDLKPLQTDRNKIAHIVMNLVSNALKFTAKGTITVTSELIDDSQWAISVEDTGVGIRDADQSDIFQEYFQHEQERRRGRGFGLGLSIVHQLVKTLHGEIEFHSVYGQGTRFRVKFPTTLPTSAAT